MDVIQKSLENEINARRCVMCELRPGLLICGCSVLLLAHGGCRSAQTIHDPEFAQVAYDSARAMSHPAAEVAAELPISLELAGAHTVDEYVVFALAQSPRIQAARKRIEARANRVPQAASLDDPMLGVNGYPFSPYVLQTAGGRSTVNVMAEQKLPWFGKLETRSCVAEAETDMARADLVAAELEVVQQVKRMYYELLFLQKAVGLTEQSRELLVQISEVADTKYRTGTVSEQDLLRAQVEVSNVDAELIRLRQQLQSARAQLAQWLHVSPDTELLAAEDLPEGQIPQDVERLYRQAINARPELHAQLAALRRDQHQVELARLQYYPDVSLSGMLGGMTKSDALSPVADGLPMVNIGAQINVPLYRKKLEAGVREAEAQAVSSARDYDALKDRTEAEIKDLFAQALSQRDLLGLFRRDIVPKSEQTLEVSMAAYRVGQTDFLQLIDNWRQLLKFRVTVHQLESQLQQTLSSLERVVGGTMPPSGPSALPPAVNGVPSVEPIPDPARPEPQRP